MLIVGAGPAGLECALALGQRGYKVGLTERRRELGGRVTDESALPGLAEWARVRDYRVYQLEKLSGRVEIYRESDMTVESILDVAYQHVVIATGSRWRSDGIGRAHTRAPIPGSDLPNVMTATDILTGSRPSSPAVIFDDDHHYLGGVIAEKLHKQGLETILLTPAPVVSSWSEETLEQELIQSRLVEMGVRIVTGYNLTKIESKGVQIAGVYGEKRQSVECSTVIMLTSRLPNDELFYGLKNRPHDLTAAGIQSVKRIGDALGPGLIAAAVWSGHRDARELDGPPLGDVPFKRELVYI